MGEWGLGEVGGSRCAFNEGRLFLPSWKETGGYSPGSSESLGAGQGHPLSVLEEETPVECSRFLVPCSPAHHGYSQIQQGLHSEVQAAGVWILMTWELVCFSQTGLALASQEGKAWSQTLASVCFISVSRGWLESLNSWTMWKGPY